MQYAWGEWATLVKECKCSEKNLCTFEKNHGKGFVFTTPSTTAHHLVVCTNQMTVQTFQLCHQICTRMPQQDALVYQDGYETLKDELSHRAT